jgi:hypothetical protein
VIKYIGLGKGETDMALVDVEYEVYKCLHCSGYLVIRVQYPYMEVGCSATLEHWKELPEWLDEPTRANISTIEEAG